MNDQTIEQEIVACGANVAPRITPADIEANIASEYYFTAEDGVTGAEHFKNLPHCVYESSLGQITICVLVLKNGFKAIGVNEGPVDPANFNAEIGRKVARTKAVDDVYKVMGYELKTRLNS